MTRREAERYRHHINVLISELTDDDAYEVTDLFGPWQESTTYALDDRVKYNDKLYKCVQAHTSQSDWTPDVTPALWTEVPPPGQIPVWVQPTGAQDAYMTGDKVKYPDENSDVYVSLVDNNVWVPTTEGLWEKEDDTR